MVRSIGTTMYSCCFWHNLREGDFTPGRKDFTVSVDWTRRIGTVSRSTANVAIARPISLGIKDALRRK